MPAPRDAAPSLSTFGLAGFYGEPAVMPGSHRHNDVELNYVQQGSMSYLFGGTPVTLAEGDVGLFWAALPHQLIRRAPVTLYSWLTIPLALFLRWRMPEWATSSVLHGSPLIARSQQGDDAQFARWHADLETAHEERRAIVLLEAQARVRRLELAAAPAHAASGMPGLAPDQGRAARMARFVAESYRRPLRVADIAAAVGLHPTYAMAVFRRAYGISLGEYLTQYRLTHAQRLLATTDIPILDLALDAGFGSASRFYAAFTRVHDRPPRAYRAQFQMSPAHGTSMDE